MHYVTAPRLQSDPTHLSPFNDRVLSREDIAGGGDCRRTSVGTDAALYALCYRQVAIATLNKAKRSPVASY
jgi:hypothetical protein